MSSEVGAAYMRSATADVGGGLESIAGWWHVQCGGWASGVCHHDMGV